MRYLTTSGGHVTAATKDAAVTLAATLDMGDVVRPAPVAKAAKKKQAMGLQVARNVWAQAQDWPQCGQDWPADSRQAAADKVLRLAGYDLDD